MKFKGRVYVVAFFTILYLCGNISSIEISEDGTDYQITDDGTSSSCYQSFNGTPISVSSTSSTSKKPNLEDKIRGKKLPNVTLPTVEQVKRDLKRAREITGRNITKITISPIGVNETELKNKVKLYRASGIEVVSPRSENSTDFSVSSLGSYIDCNDLSWAYSWVFVNNDDYRYFAYDAGCTDYTGCTTQRFVPESSYSDYHVEEWFYFFEDGIHSSATTRGMINFAGGNAACGTSSTHLRDTNGNLLHLSDVPLSNPGGWDIYGAHVLSGPCPHGDCVTGSQPWLIPDNPQRLVFTMYYTDPEVISRYHFSNSLADSSGNSHTLTYSPGTPSYTTGIDGQAIDFDGSHYAYHTSSDFDPGTGDFSVSMWVDPDRMDAYQSVIGKKGGPGEGWMIMLYNDESTISAYMKNGFCDGPHNFKSGWNHVALVKGGSSFALYVNNQPICSDTESESVSSSSNFVIGQQSDGTKPFDGQIDEVKVFRYALSPEDIRDEYENYIGCSISFPDVPPTHWAYSYIEYLYCNGIVNGYPDGSFGPGNQVTRAEFAKMVVNANSIPQYFPPTPTFPDVPSSHWSYGYVEAAVQAGIINGYQDGTFQPSKQVSRAEISKMIAIAKGWTYSGGLSDFPDVPPTHWAYNYVMTMKEKGVVNGYQDGTFKPSNQATRAETSKMTAIMMQTP